MSRQTDKPELITALLCGSVALSALLWPQPLTNTARSLVHDAIVPGQTLALAAREKLPKIPLSLPTVSPSQSDHSDLHYAELAAYRELTRQLQIENAELRAKLDDGVPAETAAYRGTPGEPLVIPELLEAAILGTETAELWRAGRLLDRGTSAGVLESALVLENTAPLLDQGEPQGLRTGQPVYSGKAIVGRIAQVGRWSSTLRPVTDPEYRGLAQLVRQTTRGLVFGAKGKFEGRGEPLCRLTHVPATEPVSLGDEVYSAERDPSLPGLMYYGKVVKAEIAPGATHWDLWIEPAVTPEQLQTVQVLRKTINPARLALHAPEASGGRQPPGPTRH